MLIIWDAKIGKQLRYVQAYHPDQSEIICMVYSPDGTIIITGFQSGYLKRWNAATLGYEILVYSPVGDSNSTF